MLLGLKTVNILCVYTQQRSIFEFCHCHIGRFCSKMHITFHTAYRLFIVLMVTI